MTSAVAGFAARRGASELRLGQQRSSLQRHRPLYDAPAALPPLPIGRSPAQPRSGDRKRHWSDEILISSQMVNKPPAIRFVEYAVVSACSLVALYLSLRA